jgi:hypothetical protein
MGISDRDYMKRQGKNDPYYERLFEARGGTVPNGERASRGRTGLPWVVGLTVFGLFVLPHIAIHGHHYRFWVL